MNAMISYIQSQGVISVCVRLVLIVLAAALLSRLVRKLIRRIVNRDGSSLPSGSIYETIAKVAIWVAGFALVLQFCLGVNASAFIAALGVGGIALSLGLQDTLSNLIGGLQVSGGKLVAKGDYIETCGVFGKVEDVTWRHTALRDESGRTHIIPNSTINSSTLIHYSDKMFISIPFVLPPGIDLDAFREEVIKRVDESCADMLAEGEHADVRLFGSVAEGMSGTVRMYIVTGYDTATAKTRISLAVSDLISRRNPHISY